MVNNDTFRPLTFCAAALTLMAAAFAQEAPGGCSGPNGALFNLEPRTNAVLQAARSVAVLPNRVSLNRDLVVATAIDNRSLGGSPDAFYVDRSNGGCTPDFEGGPPFIIEGDQIFAPSGSSTAIADAARDAFFLLDLRFSTQPDMNAVGIVRTSASTLLDSAACPSGTQSDSGTCWPTATVTNITGLNATLSNPHLAVDPRTKGIGAGDVYTVVTQRGPNNFSTSISLRACTNLKLSCSDSVEVSGGDGNADESFVQVRTDGMVTISYRNTVFPGIHPEDIKFVVCTPNGAPRPPTCQAPVPVTTEANPIFAALIGDVPLQDVLYPRHVNRLESDGHTVTTFLVYDRCDVPQIAELGVTAGLFCPKAEIAITASADGGLTWSDVTKVAASDGQQFFGNLALDSSTSTVNIAYYSTENNALRQKAQIFLAQIPQAPRRLGRQSY